MSLGILFAQTVLAERWRKCEAAGLIIGRGRDPHWVPTRPNILVIAECVFVFGIPPGVYPARNLALAFNRRERSRLLTVLYGLNDL